MIARACIQTGLHPSAFGVGAADLLEIGEAILSELHQESSRQRSTDLQDRLRAQMGRS